MAAPSIFVQKLLDQNQLALVRKVRKVLVVPEIQSEIDETCVLHMLLKARGEKSSTLALKPFPRSKTTVPIFLQCR